MLSICRPSDGGGDGEDIVFCLGSYETDDRGWVTVTDKDTGATASFHAAEHEDGTADIEVEGYGRCSARWARGDMLGALKELYPKKGDGVASDAAE